MAGGTGHHWGARLPVLFPFYTKMACGCGKIWSPFQSARGIVVKQVVIREVKSMTMSCDPVGNVILVKFSAVGAKDVCLVIPASIVFWLLHHIPVNQNPALKEPPTGPVIHPEDWHHPELPRAVRLNCQTFTDRLRMEFETEVRPNITLLLNLSNIELLRQYLANYSQNLMNTDF
jgi:hypothetical protein